MSFSFRSWLLFPLAGFEGESIPKAQELMKHLYEMFISSDSTLVEVNPLAETPDGNVMVLDSKLNFDDNAEFRQKDIFSKRVKQISNRYKPNHREFATYFEEGDTLEKVASYWRERRRR